MGSLSFNSSISPVLSKCPDCERPNLAKMNWCVACGCLLIGYDPPINQLSNFVNFQYSTDRHSVSNEILHDENRLATDSYNYPYEEDVLLNPSSDKVFKPRMNNTQNQANSFDARSFPGFELNYLQANILQQQNYQNNLKKSELAQFRQRCFSANLECANVYTQEVSELGISDSHPENCTKLQQDVLPHNYFCAIPQHNQSLYFPFRQNVESSYSYDSISATDPKIGDLSAKMLGCTAKNEINLDDVPYSGNKIGYNKKSEFLQDPSDCDSRMRQTNSAFRNFRAKGPGIQRKYGKCRWDRCNNRWSNYERDATALNREYLTKSEMHGASSDNDYSNHNERNHPTSQNVSDLDMIEKSKTSCDTLEFEKKTSAEFEHLDSRSWLSLPNELWYLTLNLLDYVDRAAIAQTCRRMHTIVSDRHVWRTIRLDRRYKLTDAHLAAIGRKKPQHLHLVHCRGEMVTTKGVRQLFSFCGKSLQKLSFVGCSKGAFQGDTLLLISALYCQNLSHIDASYTCSIRNRTVKTIAEASVSLKSVHLNGAQNITNSAIEHLVRYHKSSLERLELFGCFRLNSKIFATLGECQRLKALAFGFLHHLSSAGLLELVSKLPLLASLDLRGTQKLVTDTSLSLLATECPLLEEIILANLSSLTKEDGVITMLHQLPRLRLLDLCGLKVVGDGTLQALAISCPLLEELDISCTSVTKLGLLHLASTPAHYLKSLSTSFCHGITPESLEKVVKSCKRLSRLTLYGFSHVEKWDFLFNLRPDLIIKTETQNLKSEHM